MQNIFFLLILFLIVIASILFYLRNKTSRIQKLLSGQCPNCGESAKTFFDQNTNTTFKSEIIKSKILQNHGCSGINDVEFICEECGLKEVHSTPLNSGTCL